jgi:murein peptide amidase A
MKAILLLSYAVIFLLLGSPCVQAQDMEQKNPIYEQLAEQGRMTTASSYLYEKQEAVNGNYRSTCCGSPSKPNVFKVIGHSVQGNAIGAFFWGHGNSYVYILGAIHGNESNSSQLVERTREELEQNFSQKNKAVTFIMIPCLNPDGIYLNSRTNANNIDLNRNFPISDFSDQAKLNCYSKSSLEPLQPEILALLQLCKSYPPTLIYSIHQPFNLINYDGPAATIALDVQNFNGMRIVPGIGYATPGSLGEYFGTLKKVPVITLELPHTGKGKAWEDILYRNAEGIIYSALNWQARHTK